ncbi:MAG: DoxX family protein [Moheibacter sp.]
MKKGGLFSSETTRSNIDLSALILRVVGGGFMLYAHGIGKFTKFFSGDSIQFMNPFGIGETGTFALVVFAEAICAAFVILGLMTRYALIPLIITMAYAAFVTHGVDPFKDKELALLYWMIFVVSLLIGPGKYSLDRLIKKRRQTV